MSKLRRFGKRIADSWENYGKIRAAMELSRMGYHAEAQYIISTLHK